MQLSFSEKNRNYFLAFLVFVGGAFLIYARSFGSPWLMDDLPVIVDNPDIRSISNFLEDRYPGRPLRELTYLVDYTFFGLSPAGYHIQSNFWHGLNAFLVFVLGFRFGAAKPVAWFSAALFLVHPVLVSVVTNISHRKDSLALAFCLLTVIAYRNIIDREKTRIFWALGSVSFWLIALTAKQNASVVPFLILFLELYRKKEKLPRWVFPIGFLSCLLVITGRLIFLISNPEFKKTISAAMFKLGSIKVWDFELYYQTLLKSWAFMVKNMVFPASLSMEYVFSVPISWADPWVVASVLLVLLWVFFTWFAYSRSELAYVALIWFAIFWVPTSNLFGHFSYFAADRYWYAPAVGFFIFASYGLWLLVGKRLAFFYAIASSVLLTLIFLTIQQQGYWLDSRSFYTHMLDVSPTSLEAEIGLGFVYQEEGDYRTAKVYFERAFERDPSDYRVPLNLGHIAFLEKRYFKAAFLFNKALEKSPNNADILRNLGATYNELEMPEKALEALQRAVAIDPHLEGAYLNMGLVYESLKNYEDAVRMYRKAIDELPDFGIAHFNLGLAFYRQGDKNRALAPFEKAVRLLPTDPEAHYMYGITLLETGRVTQSRAELVVLKQLKSSLAERLERKLQESTK